MSTKKEREFVIRYSVIAHEIREIAKKRGLETERLEPLLLLLVTDGIAPRLADALNMLCELTLEAPDITNTEGRFLQLQE